MRLPGQQHLTYCTNVHPGEGWVQVQRVLRDTVPAVRAAVRPGEAFGVGLRLSARAAEELVAAGAVSDLRSQLSDRGLYVFTLNGFPYGPFHGQPVKAAVYAPDFREPARLAYTRTLVDILAGLLPAGEVGSISTVPLGFRPDFGSDAGALKAAAAGLLDIAAYLARLAQDRGTHIALGLEPEPHCALETTAEAVAFFEQHVWNPAALATFGRKAGLSGAAAEEALRAHLGLCLDACHAAVEFEDPGELLSALRAADLRVCKLQLSAGLRVAPPDAAARAALGAFDDDVYLHQVVARHGSSLSRYLDLPAALQDPGAQRADEWRIHFHVPLFAADAGPFGTTRQFLRALLRAHRQRPITTHLEVETYTWSVLPAALRSEDVVQDIARELDFVLQELA